jgi:hypothetical protein
MDIKKINYINMFQLSYPSLGSSYTPNLSMDNRIVQFNNRLNILSEEEQLLRKLREIALSQFTYKFNSRLIKNLENTTTGVLVLSLKMKYLNKIANLDLTISTITQLEPTLTPSWVYNKRTNSIDFSLDPVYDLNNILLNVNILTTDGNSHIYDAYHYGVPTDPTPPFIGPHD